MVTDPVASLKPWPTVVTVAGQDYEVPAWPAADWLSALMADPLDLNDLLYNLAPDLADAIDDALLSDALDFDDYLNLALDLVTTASGRPWFKALRLIGTVRENWDVVGAELELRGVDAARVSLGAWLDIALITVLKMMNEKDVPMFTLKLEAPAPGEEPAQMEMSADDFQALMRGQ